MQEQEKDPIILPDLLAHIGIYKKIKWKILEKKFTLWNHIWWAHSNFYLVEPICGDFYFTDVTLVQEYTVEYFRFWT